MMTLKNGVSIVYVPSSSPTVTVEANIAIGSAYEIDDTRGYAHFVEHMLFEGTKKRSNFDIANEVERVGGELNGSTNGERTRYYIKVPKKHAQMAADIIADIVVNPSFTPEIFEKEKQVILSEIDMYHDEPRLYQWLLLEKNMFTSDLGLPTLGSRDSIANASLDRLKAFYEEHYRGGNVLIVISGNVELDFSELEKLPQGKTEKTFEEAPISIKKEISEDKPITQSYLIKGYKTPKRADKESIALDVLHAHLGRGASGALFNELRNKRGVGYAVHAVHEPGKEMGMFVIAVSMKKKNREEVERVIQEQLEVAKHLSEEQLDSAKEYVLGNLAMQNEDSKNLVDYVAHWILTDSAKAMESYEELIKQVSAQDVAKVLETYFKEAVTVSLIES